jgi:hypothetical protein
MTLFVPRQAAAQLLEGTINGTLTDPTQAAIADAIVTATNQATNFVREAKTNTAGFYTLPSMPRAFKVTRARAW